ncbi:MAG TPA: efflux RND transporter periplasmic adaptor subunit [Phycisphaerales bacterium]|nr:efflux RND transporter periplasmic adaptor subunit [Phycisphaerales bacterium]
MATLKKIIIWLILILIVGGLGYGGYWYWTMRQRVKAMIAQYAAGGGTEGPVPLPVDRCTIKDITDFLEFTGTTEAVNVVEIRARVEGYLEQIHFTDGSLVEKDQLLFTIEPDIYRSRRDEAASRLKAGQTELQRAREDLERIQKAVQTGSVSRQELTRAQAAYDTAQAQVLGAQAALDMAELNLSYTEIRSPITGRIGRRLVDVGNLVGALDRTVLTTIRQIRPIYVFFHISERLLEGDLLRRLQGGEAVEPLSLSVGLPHTGVFPYSGIIDFVNNTVDPDTGTIYVRGRLANEDGSLLPGMFVRVRVPTTERQNAVLIPEKAVSTDLGGRYVLIVDDEEKLQRRDVTLGAVVDGLRVVTEGLNGDETFIVGGFHMARPGMSVEPIHEGQIPPEMVEQMPGAPPMVEDVERDETEQAD